MESVILQTPILLCGFAAAFALGVLCLAKKLPFAVNVCALFLFSATSSYALLLGAWLDELAICAVVFFIINLVPLCGRGKK
ncbi:MAG TPA: hypothetical protein IAB69_00660 [Candidatus Coproplasma excrementigallinarum]|uniref:Uncharacterized protein n=1 Tax=Candidatus Coproplasma excrementigallinarum TaxID=2840747 RepID=A0A9D1SIS2_9FIRM|nr:hypothetical protein [Candidatus Coproplasma excrementigallinarum]